jgi:hypothetical protein
VDQGPVGEVDSAGGGIVELDELVGRVGTGAEADLVDLDREAFRTLWAVVSNCVPPVVWFFHSALPVRKPAPVVAGEVTLKAALTVAPGATGSVNVFDVSVAPTVHPVGTEMPNLTSIAGAPVVFVNVSGPPAPIPA